MSGRAARFFSIICFFSLVCAGCSNGGGVRPLTGELDSVDSLIENGEYDDAAKLLKKAERHITSSWDSIGVFRRYIVLGETECAENVLKKALKRTPRSPELAAVYSNFLLRAGRTDEALSVARNLPGTRYGSFYSEALLRKTALTGVAGMKPYLDPKFFSVYYDAYTGSKNTCWLRDCAVLCMLEGNTERVLTLHPERYTSLSDAYFWALVEYDCGNFNESLAALEGAGVHYDYSIVTEKQRITKTELTVLTSDVYTALSDADRAEQVRRALLAQLAGTPDDPGIRAAAYSALLPYIYVNCAEWSAGRGDDEQSRTLLSTTVKRWPDFVPGLTSYADFAWRTSLPRTEDEEQQVLRASGVATLEMQRYDNRARIPVSDAAARMDESLKRTHDPLLYIARLDLKYRSDSTLSADDKIADLWRVLEKNTTDTDQYPPLLFEYAVNLLIRYDRLDDAWRLYRTFIASKYSFDSSLDFWNQAVKNVRSFTLKEAEYGAWFAAEQQRADSAERLYEYCVFESSGDTKEGAARVIAPEVADQSCINLAMIYNCLNNRDGALDLYGRTAGRTARLKLKAEILYRMACVYRQQGNKQDALRSAQYALSFDASNARAKLLADELSAQNP